MKRKVENEELDGLSAEEIIDLLMAAGYGYGEIMGNPKPVNKKSGFDYVCGEVYYLEIDNEIVDRKVIKEYLKVIKREVDSASNDKEVEKILARPIIFGSEPTPFSPPSPEEEIRRVKEYYYKKIESK